MCSVWLFQFKKTNNVKTLCLTLVYVVNRQHKDIALISLGNVLHHTRYSNEAAVILHSSLDVSRELDINYFTLGNIYAVCSIDPSSMYCTVILVCNACQQISTHFLGHIFFLSKFVDSSTVLWINILHGIM